MKSRNVLRYLLITLFWIFSICHPLLAIEKIYSLTVKQQEIETAIRNGLNNYLEPRNYVLKVDLTGKKVREAPPVRLPSSQIAPSNGGLPGFEPDQGVIAPSITDVIGETYWVITQMKIDLVMHKKVSSSELDYIKQMVPVVSGMDAGRGDKFNFIPIVPKPLKKEKGFFSVGQDEDALPTAEGEKSASAMEKKWLDLSLREWIFIVLFVLMFAIFIILFTRNRRLYTALQTLPEEWEEEQERKYKERRDKESKSATEELQTTRLERLHKQEDQIKDALLQDDNDRISQEIIKDLIGRQDWATLIAEEATKDKISTESFIQLINIFGPQASRKLFAEAMGSEAYIELEKLSMDEKISPQQANVLLRDYKKNVFFKKLQSPEKIQVDPFLFMRKLTVNQISFLIKEEPVKIKAVVLSRLDSEDASQIMRHLPKAERNQVLLQLGKMDQLPLELIEKVGYDLAEKAKRVPDDTTVFLDSVGFVVDVMGTTDPNTRNDMINGLRSGDQKLSAQVESRFFMFDSIPVVPRDVLMQVVRVLPPDDVITAISGAQKELQEAVIMCFPVNNRRALVSALKGKRPDPETIKIKRKLIVKGMQNLALEGKVDLQKIAAEWDQRGRAKAS